MRLPRIVDCCYSTRTGESGETGRRAGFRILYLNRCGGSTPPSRIFLLAPVFSRYQAPLGNDSGFEAPLHLRIAVSSTKNLNRWTEQFPQKSIAKRERIDRTFSLGSPMVSNPRNRLLFVLAWILTSVAITCASDMVTVTEIGGAKSSGGLMIWSTNQLSLSATPAAEINLSNVRSVEFERQSQKPNDGRSLIWLSNGDRIFARAVKVSDDALTISWPVLSAASLPTIPLEKVIVAILELPLTMPERLRLFREVETTPPGSDLVILSNGDRSIGEFQKLDASFVELKVAKSQLKLDRSRVVAVRLNPELTNVKRTSGRRAILSLVDGSRITATSMQLVDGIFQLTTPSLGRLSLLPASIKACHFYGERVIPISDYEPTKVEFTPYLSSTWPLVRNANVRGGPLMLRGTEFPTGLGMHSRMVVNYELRGNEQTFQSIVGIDDSANGAGSAVFAVELDDQRVWTSKDLTGLSAATTIPEINVRGGKRLTLVVDFGQFADVSDHADWCDAVLVTEPPQ